MVRIGKFVTGDFCLDQKSKELGRISEQSSLSTLVIKWYPSQVTERISLAPKGKQEVRALASMRRWKKVDLKDFGLVIKDCPTRINKVLHSSEKDLVFIQVTLSSICLKKEEPSKEEFLENLLPVLKLVYPQASTLKMKHKGAILDSLLELYFEV